MPPRRLARQFSEHQADHRDSDPLSRPLHVIIYNRVPSDCCTLFWLGHATPPLMPSLKL